MEASSRNLTRSRPFYSLRNILAAEQTSVEPQPASQSRPQPRSGTTFFLYACAIAAFPSILPVVLLLIPVSKPQKLQGVAEESNETSVVTNSPGVAATVPLHLANCSRRVALSDNIRDLWDRDVSKPYPMQTSSKFTVCCIYNNSRFRKPERFDYLPKHVPVDLCPCLVYWSMGIERGRVVSRTPKFDERYGLKKLSGLKKSWSKIHVTVGGYSEDSYEFSRLGLNISAMAHFVQDVLDTLVQNKLDGVNLQWNHPNDSCGRPRDHDTLLEVVSKIRDKFASHRLYHLQISLLVTGAHEAWKNYDLSRLLPVLDYGYFETHGVGFESGDVHTACRQSVVNFERVMGNVPAVVRPKVCFSVTVLPWAWRLVQASSGDFVLKRASPQRLSRIAGRASLYEFCHEKTSPYTINLDNCVSFLKAPSSRLEQWMLLVLQSQQAYEKMLRKIPCVTVFDIDLDVYRDNCPKSFEQYYGLLQLWEAVGSLQGDWKS